MNSTEVFTSRHLKINKPYRLLNLAVTEEMGFNGPYKKATGVLKDSSRPTGTITVSLPKPVSNFSPDMVEELNENARSGRHARFVVRSIKTKSRIDGKGTYDLVDFAFI